MENNRVRRPVRLADFLVIGAAFIHNLTTSLDTATEELLQLSIYHANRETQINNVWEEFTTDLETIPEGTDGA